MLDEFNYDQNSQALFGPMTHNDDDVTQLTQFEFNEDDQSILLTPVEPPTKFVKRQINFDQEVQNYLNSDHSAFKQCKLIINILFLTWS